MRTAAVVVLPYIAWRLFCRRADMPPGCAKISDDYAARGRGAPHQCASLVGHLREMLSTTTVLTIAALAALIVALRALLLAGCMVWRGTWRPAAK